MSTHAYIGITPDGIVKGAVVDVPAHRDDTAEEVKSWIRDGWSIERVTVEVARSAFGERWSRAAAPTIGELPWKREREGKPGDRFEHQNGVVVTVDSQADGNVYWKSKNPQDAISVDLQSTIEEWHRLVTKAMDSGAVKFVPAA